MSQALDQQAVINNTQSLIPQVAQLKADLVAVSAMLASNNCPILKGKVDALAALIDAQAISDALSAISAMLASDNEILSVQ